MRIDKLEGIVCQACRKLCAQTRAAEIKAKSDRKAAKEEEQSRIRARQAKGIDVNETGGYFIARGATLRVVSSITCLMALRDLKQDWTHARIGSCSAGGLSPVAGVEIRRVTLSECGWTA